MRVKMTFAVLALAALALALPASSLAGGSRGEAGESIRVIATGLNDPRGIDADDADHGDRLLVAQSGSGEITEILVRKKGDPVIGAFAALTADSSPSDVVAYGFNKAFVTAGVPPEAGAGDPFGGLVKVRRGGESSVVANITAYQEGDPDPVDQEGLPTESNPFGVALVRHGVLVTDAAGNDLLKIKKNGSIETVARFPTRTLDGARRTSGRSAGRNGDRGRGRPDCSGGRPGRRLVRVGAARLPLQQGNVPDLEDRAGSRRRGV